MDESLESTRGATADMADHLGTSISAPSGLFQRVKRASPTPATALTRLIKTRFNTSAPSSEGVLSNTINNPPAIISETLNSLGYGGPNNPLSDLTHPPWEDPKLWHITSPQVWELLIDLHHLSLGNPWNRPVMELAKQLASNESVVRLGKLLFLVDREETTLVKLLAESPAETLSGIDHCLDVHLQAVFHQPLNARIEIPQRVAALLITKSGGFNSGLIEAILDHMKANTDSERPFAVTLIRSLQSLRHNPTLRRLLQTIQGPSKQWSIAAEIIRLTVGLVSSAPVGAREARQTALEGLLTHMRQEMGEGNCSAASIAIDVLSEQPERALSDFGQLLEHGSLVRQIAEKPHRFSFLIHPREFVRLSRNFLHEAYQHAIANMAENPIDGKMTRSIIKAVRQAMIPLLPPLSSQDQLHLLERLKDHMLAQLRIVYDPSLIAPGSTTQKTPPKGGFVVHIAQTDDDPQQWTRIDNPEAFTDYVCTAAAAVTPSNIDRSYIDNVLKTGQFTADCLNAYRTEQGAPTAPLSAYRELKFTPWVSAVGGDTQSLRAIFEGQLRPLRSICAPNAEQLLIQLIDDLRQHPKIREDDLAPHTRIPVRIPNVHAFSLLPGHPSWVDSWREDAMDIRSWIQARVQTPGFAIAHSAVPESMQKKLVEFASEQLVPATKKRRFLSSCARLSTRSITEFRMALLRQVTTMRNSTIADQETVGEALDESIVNAMTLEMRQNLSQSTIHIADTNWGENSHDLHFCLIVNPGTAKLELWIIYEDGSLMRPVSQRRWVTQQPWQLLIL